MPERRATAATLLVAISGASLAGCAADGQQSMASVTHTATPAAGDAQDHVADGVYTAVGWYGSLPSHHEVTIGLEDGMVASVEITTPAQDPTSLEYQERFAEALPEAVIGRPLDTIRIDRLAGSSGSSAGFMAALADISDQARTAGD